jgi:uncharacterized protein (DUF2147 family)
MLRNVFAAGLEILSWIMVALLCIGLGTLPARAAQPGPVGAWVTSGGDAVIQIYQCGDDLCGAISGMVLAPTDRTPVDWQGQTQCGLVIVRTVATPTQDSNPAWFGSIVDPRNGSVYHARLSLDAYGNLQLRGYVGLPIFGRTQTWTRYTGTPLPADCRLNSISTITAASGAGASNG